MMKLQRCCSELKSQISLGLYEYLSFYTQQRCSLGQSCLHCSSSSPSQQRRRSALRIPKHCETHLRRRVPEPDPASAEGSDIRQNQLYFDCREAPCDFIHTPQHELSADSSSSVCNADLWRPAVITLPCLRSHSVRGCACATLPPCRCFKGPAFICSSQSVVVIGLIKFFF